MNKQEVIVAISALGFTSSAVPAWHDASCWVYGEAKVYLNNGTTDYSVVYHYACEVIILENLKDLGFIITWAELSIIREAARIAVEDYCTQNNLGTFGRPKIPHGRSDTKT